MKRVLAAVLICALGTTPLAAQERGVFSKITFGAEQIASAPAPTPQPQAAPVVHTGRPGIEKALYAISIGASIGGTVWVARNTREALDDGLEVRTFPLVWLKTSDPKDKGKVTAVLAATNGAVIAISALAFKNHNARAAILLNFFVAGLTTAVAVHERSVINKQR
jgi:hypothetical protein